jgi:hypothetical protein
MPAGVLWAGVQVQQALWLLLIIVASLPHWATAHHATKQWFAER